MLDLEEEEEKASSKIVLLESFVKKRSTLYIYRKRYMELHLVDGQPRLQYFHASTKNFRAEIKINKTTRAFLMSDSKFEIRGDHETLYFKDPYGHVTCEQWVQKINEASRIASRRGS